MSDPHLELKVYRSGQNGDGAQPIELVAHGMVRASHAILAFAQMVAGRGNVGMWVTRAPMLDGGLRVEVFYEHRFDIRGLRRVPGVLGGSNAYLYRFAISPSGDEGYALFNQVVTAYVTTCPTLHQRSIPVSIAR